jgi:hypothetical protein
MDRQICCQLKVLGLKLTTLLHRQPHCVEALVPAGADVNWLFRESPFKLLG